MKLESFVIEPGFGCPFYVEALRFTPIESYDDGLTLLCFHAFNLHKETFIPLIQNLLNIISPLRIQDVWAIDNPNQGRSARLNHDLLTSKDYSDKWSASEYSRAAYSFLSTTSHGFDFRRRRLIGVAHSGGATGLMMLKKTHPEVTFQGLVLMDPGLLPPHKESSIKLTRLFRKLSLSKRDTWPNMEEAKKEFTNGAYRGFHSAALESFLECGLLPPNPSGAVALACSKFQEAAYYAAEDVLKPPSEVLLALQKEDKLPVHLIVCLKDEYRGLSDDMKSFQVDTVGKMSCGSVQFMERGGHMFPQVEPRLAAGYVRNALMKIDHRCSRL